MDSFAVEIQYTIFSIVKALIYEFSAAKSGILFLDLLKL